MGATYIGLNGSLDEALPSGTTVTYTTTRTISAGEFVVLELSARWDAGMTVSAVTVGSLSLSRDLHVIDGNGDLLEFWSATAGSTIASGSTITITKTGSGTQFGTMCVSLGGVATTSSLRTSSQHLNPSTYDCGTTGTAQAGDIALGAVEDGGTSNAPTAGAGCTLVHAGYGGNGINALEYQALVSTGTVDLTFGGTVGYAPYTVAGSVVYAAAGGGGGGGLTYDQDKIRGTFQAVSRAAFYMSGWRRRSGGSWGRSGGGSGLLIPVSA